MKDHEIAQLVNELTSVFKEFHNHQSLRERIKKVVVAAVKPTQVQGPSPELQKVNAAIAAKTSPIITSEDAVAQVRDHAQEAVEELAKELTETKKELRFFKLRLGSAQYILDDVPAEKVSDISGLPMGVVVNALRNIFKREEEPTDQDNDRH